MSEIIDRVSGWQVEDGDFIILDGAEVEVLTIVDDEDGVILIDIYSSVTGDVEHNVPILADSLYDIWGE